VRKNPRLYGVASIIIVVSGGGGGFKVVHIVIALGAVDVVIANVVIIVVGFGLWVGGGGLRSKAVVGHDTQTAPTAEAPSRPSGRLIPAIRSDDAPAPPPPTARPLPAVPTHGAAAAIASDRIAPTISVKGHIPGPKDSVAFADL